MATKINPAIDGKIYSAEDVKKLVGTTQKCQMCGKLARVKEANAWDTNETGMALVAGKLVCGEICANHAELGRSRQSHYDHRIAQSGTFVPEGSIKVSDLGKVCSAHNVPIRRLVTAIGGDRGYEPALGPAFVPFMVKGARYVDAWCGTADGLKAIMTKTYPKTGPAVTTQQRATKKVASKK